MKRIKLNKQTFQKAKQDLQLKKKLDFAHKTIHKKSLVHTRRHLTSRLDSVKNLNTRRMLSSWSIKFILIAVLTGLSYAHLNPSSRYEGFIDGGSVIVGIKDENNKIKLNPLTLSSPAEQAIGRLVYSSLLQYDSSGKLKGDLASTYSSEDGGKRLRFNLKDNLKWQDGHALTAEDIAFTIAELKQPRINSSLRDSLAGVEATVVNPQTVDISSAKPLAGLDDLLTRIRIAPKHLFEGISPEEVGSVNYNELPVGSGALEIGSFVTTKDTSTLGIQGAGTFQQLKLNISKNYYGNQAQADLTVRIFNSKQNLEDAFKGGLVEIFISGENSQVLSESYQQLELALSSGVFSFFNLENTYLKDLKVRQALAGITDRRLISELSGGVGPLYSPVLEVPGSAPEILSLERARALITEAGWQFDATKSTFTKNGQELELNLVTGDSERIGLGFFGGLQD
jgi:peptide/nickel transport system substrate-binding protein